MTSARIALRPLSSIRTLGRGWLLRLVSSLAMLSCAICCSYGVIVNRWSFNNAAGAAAAGTVITDSVSGSNGVIVGTGASFTGSALTIPGTTTGNQTPTAISAYVDLP